MKAFPTERSGRPLMHAFALCAATILIATTAFAQASSPVTSSVFVHHSFDTGNSAINENFQFIAHPPMRPVAASAPTVTRSPHRGRRGQAGATGSGANDTATAVPLPQVPADGTTNAPISQ
ncbi:hypothetical protein ACFSHT_18260 [Paraburkholderia silviterrae]|uniref:Uncharacterized protein n=1 Tax=Paraburkholderia silviterrae TaxID=2528715 RepID=A0A4R5M9G0_9BURK|nr:hypothetical protein [Paraburkholderia silviterrae]TDG22803.1 hypothetical protein EYW47_16445 [Paraburkholderia silviterrae]